MKSRIRDLQNKIEIGLELRIWLHVELRILICSQFKFPRKATSSEKGLRKHLLHTFLRTILL